MFPDVYFDIKDESHENIHVHACNRNEGSVIFPTEFWGYVSGFSMILFSIHWQKCYVCVYVCERERGKEWDAWIFAKWANAMLNSDKNNRFCMILREAVSESSAT